MPIKEPIKEYDAPESINIKSKNSDQWQKFLEDFYFDTCDGLSNHFIPIGWLVANEGSISDEFDKASELIKKEWFKFIFNDDEDDDYEE